MNAPAFDRRCETKGRREIGWRTPRANDLGLLRRTPLCVRKPRERVERADFPAFLRRLHHQGRQPPVDPSSGAYIERRGGLSLRVSRRCRRGFPRGSHCWGIGVEGSSALSTFTSDDFLLLRQRLTHACAIMSRVASRRSAPSWRQPPPLVAQGDDDRFSGLERVLPFHPLVLP